MQKEKIKIKNKKGITLVALVVTIVVLIILATISINIIFGEEGIITKAKQAKQDMINAQDKETTEIAKITNNIEEHINSSRNEGNDNNYSLEEKIVGTWIDGKTIYEITRIYDNNGNGYAQGVNELENVRQTLDVNTIVNYSGIRIYNSNNANFDSYKVTYSISDNNCSVRCEDGILKIVLANTAVQWKAYITIQYTKNSDYEN